MNNATYRFEHLGVIITIDPDARRFVAQMDEHTYAESQAHKFLDGGELDRGVKVAQVGEGKAPHEIMAERSRKYMREQLAKPEHKKRVKEVLDALTGVEPVQPKSPDDDRFEPVDVQPRAGDTLVDPESGHRVMALANARACCPEDRAMWMTIYSVSVEAITWRDGTGYRILKRTTEPRAR